MMPLRKISSVAVQGGFRLAIGWSEGAKAVVDLAGAIEQGGVFSPLSDAALFSKVRVGERGRTIEWPEPMGQSGEPLIEIDAEALAAMATMQSPVRRRLPVRASMGASKLRGAS